MIKNNVTIKLYLAQNDQFEWAGTVCTFRDINPKPSSQFSSSLDSGGGLTRIRWHLLMIDSVLSCHFQLPLFLSLGCFSFVPSVTAMLQGTLVIQSLSISSLQFVKLHLSSTVLPLYPSLVSAPCLVLALLLSFFFLPVFVILWLRLIFVGGGRRRRRFSALRDALGGVQLVKGVQSKCRWKYLSIPPCAVFQTRLYFSLVMLI